MNEKFNKNAKVEKLTKKVGRGVRLIVIGPYNFEVYYLHFDVCNAHFKIYHFSVFTL